MKFKCGNIIVIFFWGGYRLPPPPIRVGVVGGSEAITLIGRTSGILALKKNMTGRGTWFSKLTFFDIFFFRHWPIINDTK